MRLLVTRPDALGRETAARLMAAGHDVILSPLLAPRALDWNAPEGPFDALMFTSPQAPAFAGPKLAAYGHLPAYAVGQRTAAAARAAGFADVRVGAPEGRVLHLCGREVTPSDRPATRVAVYAAELAPLTDEAVAALRDGLDAALLYSARTGAQFGAECDRAALDRATIAIVAISERALFAAGPGWREVAVAVTPDEAGVFAAAGQLCEKRGD